MSTLDLLSTERFAPHPFLCLKNLLLAWIYYASLQAWSCNVHSPSDCHWTMWEIP